VRPSTAALIDGRDENNGCSRSGPSMRLSAISERNREGTALIDGNDCVTFAKLFDKSEALAASLGLDQAGSPAVAFVADNDTTSVALFCALLERRIATLPLNPRLSVAEQRTLVGLAQARWLTRNNQGFCDVRAADGHAPPLSDQSPSPPRSVRTESVCGASPAAQAACVCSTGKPQLLMATSGSTGVPKLVQLSLAALVTAATAGVAHLGVTSRDRWLLSLGLAHIGGISIVLRCLLAEAPIVLAQPGLPAAELKRIIEQSGATLASLVPTQLDRLLSLSPVPRFPTLRAVLVGGAKAPLQLLERARTAGWPVLSTYGMSEAGSQVTTQPLTDLSCPHVIDDAGFPLPGVELKIEDGTILIRGPMLFDGYFADPCSAFDNEGWFRTGDFGRLTEAGRLVPLGRRDDCIVTGGEKVSALEVEVAVLSQSLVRAVAVVALSDDTWGQIVAAAVVADSEVEDSAQWIRRLQAGLAQNLAPHKRPRRWLRLDRLPELPNGKIDRLAVAALFAAPSANGVTWNV
jgi:o-succinylbenzoate---CoA ligase